MLRAMIFLRCIIKITLLCIFFVFFWLEGHAYSGREDYVWLEPSKDIVRRDGSVEKGFFIRLGSYVAGLSNFQELKGLEAIYTFGERRLDGSYIFKKLKIIKEGDRLKIKLNTKDNRWCLIIVRAKMNDGALEYNYLAQTSFLAFGKDSGQQEDGQVVFFDSTRQFNFGVYYERIGESFNHNYLQYGPVRLLVVFENTPFSNKLVTIIEPDGRPTQIKTNNMGLGIYVPTPVGHLNKKPTKELRSVVFAEKISDTKVFRGSCTILYGFKLPLNKTGNNRDLVFGVTIFLTSAILFFICALFLRKVQKL